MSNSLAAVHPELIVEWSDRNLPLTPDSVTFGSDKKEVPYEKCEKCDRTAYRKAKEKCDNRKRQLEKKYKKMTVGYESILFLLAWYSITTTLQYHSGDNEYSYCNLLWGMDKISYFYKSHYVVATGTYGLYRNQMLCERTGTLLGNK